MPTIITHTVVACVAGVVGSRGKMPLRFWLLSIVVAVLPDADVIGFSLGVPYGHVLGHRGFFHSLPFALVLSVFVVSVFFRQQKPFSRSWSTYIVYFFLLGASHGILDAFTDGGLGIALFSPFDTARYFAPWTPIEVSPIRMSGLLSQRGLAVLTSEIVWVWLPLGVLFICLRFTGREAKWRLNAEKTHGWTRTGRS